MFTEVRELCLWHLQINKLCKAVENDIFLDIKNRLKVL